MRRLFLVVLGPNVPEKFGSFSICPRKTTYEVRSAVATFLTVSTARRDAVMVVVFVSSFPHWALPWATFSISVCSVSVLVCPLFRLFLY